MKAPSRILQRLQTARDLAERGNLAMAAEAAEQAAHDLLELAETDRMRSREAAERAIRDALG